VRLGLVSRHCGWSSTQPRSFFRQALNRLLFPARIFFDLFWQTFAAGVALLGEPMYPIMTFDLPPQAFFCASRVHARRKPTLAGSFPDETPHAANSWQISRNQ
jgi:hypothetical protein